MVYSLTEKLKFEENPKIEIGDKTITVNSEAETALKLLDILESEGETAASLKAPEILFSARDLKIIRDLKLNMTDYATLIATAISLCLGNDPDEDEKSE